MMRVISQFELTTDLDMKNITNWFSLLEYLPKSDLEKLKIKNEIKSIESSPFY